jgi:hypothetical protein
VFSRRPDAGPASPSGGSALRAEPDPSPPATVAARARSLPETPGWLVLLVGAFVLAAGSLLVLPHGIAYDPWSWVIWGREVTHLDLDTRRAATAIKPLPILVTTVLAPTGSWAPVLWLVVSRAGALLSLALAFRLGRRLGGVGAGIIAAVGLAACNQYLSYLFMAGMSEPVAVAAMLAAADNALQSRRRSTLGCLAAAGLLRPEAWFFLIGYCAWLGLRASLPRRVLLAAIAVVIPSSWFVLDWFGSGHLLRSEGASSHQSQGGPLLSRDPGLAVVRETWHLVSGPIIVLFLLGLGVALVSWRRDGRARPSLWLGLAALGWLVITAAMSQARIATGANRYLLPGAALGCVVAGVFVADCARALIRLRPDSRAPVAVIVLGILALGAFFSPRVRYVNTQLHHGVVSGHRLTHLADSLPNAIRLAGGRDAIIGCGPVSTEAFQVPLVAWQLRLHLEAVTIHTLVPGTVLQQARSPRIPAALSSSYRNLGTVGPAGDQWTVLTTCPPAAGPG